MTSRNRLSRRSFLESAGLFTAAGWSSLASGRAPSKTVRVGVIGTGVRGKYLIGNLPDAVKVVAICDCAQLRMHGTLSPEGQFKAVLAGFVDRDAAGVTRYQDYRKLIDQSDLDAVIIATPDHHHAQAALLALQAGLDVYLEKPLATTIDEGRRLVDAVRKTGRVLQVGSQQRTMEMNQFGCEFIRDGGLGTISHVELPNYPGPISEPSFSEEPIPSGLNWEMFLGPTPERPHNRKLWMKEDFRVGDLLWRGWDLFRDYSGHLMTNWGAHSVDMVQYALGMDECGPVKIVPNHSISSELLDRDWQSKWNIKTPTRQILGRSESIHAGDIGVRQRRETSFASGSGSSDLSRREREGVYQPKQVRDEPGYSCHEFTG